MLTLTLTLTLTLSPFLTVSRTLHCRSQKQKWELAAAAEEHMALTLRRVHAELVVVAGSSSVQEFARQPGLAMMLDLLGTFHVQ